MTARSRIAGCGERGHVGATYNPWRTAAASFIADEGGA